MGLPTYFLDDTAQTAREAEVTGADFDNGMNNGATCAPGIGINFGEGAVVGTPEQFTLLDQFENARNAQISQSIGGLGFVDRSSVPWPGSGGDAGTLPDSVVRAGTPSVSGDGTVTAPETAALVSLANGWLAGI